MIYVSVSGIFNKPDVYKINVLLHVIGEESDEIMLQFSNTYTEFEDVLSVFENYFILRRNVTFERINFKSKIQKPNEYIDSFITALYSLGEHCLYGV